MAARNRAISKLRRKTGKNEELDENGADLRVNVESSAAQKLLLEKVRALLSDDERRLAEQRGRGDSWAEIAAANAGTPEGLRKKLARAVERAMRQLGLDEDGDE